MVTTRVAHSNGITFLTYDTTEPKVSEVNTETHKIQVQFTSESEMKS